MFFSWSIYLIFVPIILWVLLYFWFLKKSYPLYFKKLLKKNIKWSVLPDLYAKNPSKIASLKFQTILFVLLVAVISAYELSALLHVLGVFSLEFLIAFAVLFLLCSYFLYRFAMKKVAEIYQSAYFLEYRKVRYAEEIKGNFQSEFDVQNRTLWSFTRKLKRAERSNKLWKYVNAMAKSKKIPPDIYAEVAYG